MTSLLGAIDCALDAQRESKKPLGIILAGHNGSGKSTMWYKKDLAGIFQIPLINADRMMMSIFPEVPAGQSLIPEWALKIRDGNEGWMRIAQKGVAAFVDVAMVEKVPFAMETVFSHWKDLGDGRFESKVDLITEMQDKGYYVLLLFVGLSNAQLSLARVKARAQQGGHDVSEDRIKQRFPRTQMAIKHACSVADAAILVDNSWTEEGAFTVCRLQLGDTEIYDCRNRRKETPQAILEWLSIVSPR